MPLYGTLRTMPLVDLLGWLGSVRKTGTLQVERNHVRKWIVFRDGEIHGCASDDPPGKLGHFLLSQGRISEDQLRIALAAQQDSGKHLGRIFVEMGSLTEAELISHLEAKAEETILSLFDGPEAVFRFHEEIQDDGCAAVRLSVEQVIERGRERQEELARIRTAFPSQRIVLQRTGQPPPDEALAGPMARQLFEAVDGQRTLGEVLLHVHGSEFLVTRFLYELHRAGFVSIVAASVRAAAPVPQPVLVAPRAETIPGRDLRPAPPTAPAAAVGAVTAAAPQAVPVPVDLGVDLDWDSVTPGDDGGEILDIPELFAESSDVEAIENSVAHQVDKKLERVRRLMETQEYADALGILDELYRRYPDDDGLRRLMDEAEAAFKDRAYRHYLPANMVPRVRMSPEEIQSQTLSPSEFFLLSRMDGTWDVRSIIQVAPIREIEALLTLKRLRERGVIELREPQRRKR